MSRLPDDAHSVFVLGASGDLARKKTYPALFELFVAGLLPRVISIIGYARSAIADAKFRDTLRPALKGSEASVEAFLALCIYRSGNYDDAAAFGAASAEVRTWEEKNSVTGAANRIFYFAVPPTVFTTAAKTIHSAGLADKGWSRVVVEKPFGRDLASSSLLSAELAKYFSEDQIYRIDHYLGKEMVQNLMVLRFANTVFEPLWNRHHISNVQITFKEPFGTEGRGGYFDEFGIIRDVMQNHLMQVLSLVAMEPPVAATAEFIRNEKVKVLQCTAPASLDNVVVGQYGASAAADKPGYLSDAGVPPGSLTPTFATAVVFINNSRWHGVPFILKCGKALDERKAEIRIQFTAPAAGIFSMAGAVPGGGTAVTCESPSASAGAGGGATGVAACAAPVVGVGQKPLAGATAVHNNELVIRIQPNEAVYLKMMSKLPGMEYEPVETELSLSYKSRYPTRPLPEAYARLLLDVLRGDQSQFVRSDELQAAWAIFTPLLHALEAARVRPVVYPFGSRGPPQSDSLIGRWGYVHEGGYSGEWKRTQDPGAAVAALAAVDRDYSLSTARLQSILAHLGSEMRAGLAGAPSTVAMIPSFVTALPAGTETGTVWAVDMGGTNLRVVQVSLLGGGKMGCMEPVGKRQISAELQRADGALLFDFVARMMVDAGMADGAVVGFTFSFPTAQTAIGAGTLMAWTKGFTCANVEGRDPAQLLREACTRQGLRVNVAALVNDTVGTLLTTAYGEPRARIGVILGTGTNAAYLERVANIPKWTAPPPASGAMVINMEWGNFGSGADRSHLPFTAADAHVDVHSPNPGAQRFEKMISGMYLGELVRLVLLQLVAAGAVFVHAADAAAPAAAPTAAAGGALRVVGAAQGVKRAAAKALSVTEVFQTSFVSQCCADSSDELRIVESVLHDALHISASTLEDRTVVKHVCMLVSRRAARLAAVGVAACVKQMGEVAQLAAGIDGSVYKHHPFVRSWMLEALEELGAPHCDLLEAEDGSGRGAALVALVAANK